MKFKKITVLIFGLVSCIAHAIDDSTVSTKITDMFSYNQYGGGDVVFNVENHTTNCSTGYWITKSDPGFSANFAIILTAYMAHTPIRVVGLPEQKWTGSAGTYCKVYTISPA